MAATWLLLYASGCAKILDLPSQPKLVGPWACLYDARTPVAKKENVHVRVQVCDYLSECESPVQDVSAKVCHRKDVDCRASIEEDVRDHHDGLLEFEVPTRGTGFDGYISVSPPTADCGDVRVFPVLGMGRLCSYINCNPDGPPDSCLAPIYAPALMYFNPPITADVEEPIRLPLLLTDLGALADLVAPMFDAQQGHVFIQALDCDGHPAPGVRFRLDASDGTALYISGGVPNLAAKETGPSGVGGFFNIPPHIVQISGTIVSDDPELDGKLVGEPVGLNVASRTVSYAIIAPYRGSSGP